MKFKGIRNKLDYFKYQFISSEKIFTDIYKNNRWKGLESRSGIGSDLKSTEHIQEELPKLFKELKISSILDIPCGDFWWLKEVDLSFLFYTGADIVEDIIKNNSENYSNEKRIFLKLDITKDFLPTSNLIFCRDIFIHLSFSDIKKAIKNIKNSSSKYLLTNSYDNIMINHDISTGGWRPINLMLPPFTFPRPIRSIHEKFFEKDYDKNLYLWKISDLIKFTYNDD